MESTESTFEYQDDEKKLRVQIELAIQFVEALASAKLPQNTQLKAYILAMARAHSASQGGLDNAKNIGIALEIQ